MVWLDFCWISIAVREGNRSPKSGNIGKESDPEGDG